MVMSKVFSLCCVGALTQAGSPKDRKEYDALRAKLVGDNARMSFDAETVLTTQELVLDARLVAKRDEYITSSKADGTFEPAKFFHTWNLTKVRQEPVFQFLDALPKGGNLHLHSGSSGSVDWYIEHALETEGCHIFWHNDTPKHFKGTIGFYKQGEAPEDFEPCDSVAKNGRSSFQRELRDVLTSGREVAKMDSTRAWEFFQSVFSKVGPAMSDKAFHMRFLKNAFQVHFESGVQHVEIRTVLGADNLGALTDMDGNVYSGATVVQSYLDAWHAFQQEGPEQAKFTVRMLPSSVRSRTPEQIRRDLELAVDLRERFPDFVTGWDAVSEEDAGHDTLDYVGAFFHARKYGAAKGVELPLFLHDGESTSRNDSNVIDAVLLGCPRIGHGFNTGMFFPAAREEMKRKGTVLEVAPISNQILRYVTLETHPAAALALDGVRIVLASDDPLVFGYTGLTMDWWAATLAWRLDLKSLKTLALNSLRYSTLTGKALDDALRTWQQNWNAFVASKPLDEKQFLV